MSGTLASWTVIGDAAAGRREALAEIVQRGTDADDAALATLLLLEEAPHPAAALVAAARSPDRIARLVRAALAPHVAPALAAWRADPRWIARAVGAKMKMRRGLARGAAGMVGALRDDPAAQRAAVDIVLRDDDGGAIDRCLAALGADGWHALEDDRRAALLARADPDDLGRIWGALDDAQRAAAAQRAARCSDVAANLIGRIGAAAWDATDPALRETLMNAVLRDPWRIVATAPAWAGMTAAERETLARAAIAHNNAEDAFLLLDALGVVGRATLTVKQRAALEQSAMDHPDAWRVPAWRAADAGWGALTDEERDALMTAADQEPWLVPDLLRIVGVAGWRAMDDRERARIAVAVRHAPANLFACPPALWSDLAGDALSPATTISTISWFAPLSWRAEDVDADLGGLPPAHRALALALAPWRTEDAVKDSVRAQRLRVAWGALPDDERVALATTHPPMLATVAAAARLRGGASAAVAAVGATVARIVTATGGADAKRAVAAMLRTPDRWRSWMIAFAPNDGDPPDAWAAWRAAARRGSIADVALCARLAAKERAAGPARRPCRRG